MSTKQKRDRNTIISILLMNLVIVAIQLLLFSPILDIGSTPENKDEVSTLFVAKYLVSLLSFISFIILIYLTKFIIDTYGSNVLIHKYSKVSKIINAESNSNTKSLIIPIEDEIVLKHYQRAYFWKFEWLIIGAASLILISVLGYMSKNVPYFLIISSAICIIALVHHISKLENRILIHSENYLTPNSKEEKDR